jgi:hypothetical protein
MSLKMFYKDLPRNLLYYLKRSRTPNGFERRLGFSPYKSIPNGIQVLTA